MVKSLKSELLIGKHCEHFVSKIWLVAIFTGKGGKKSSQLNKEDSKIWQCIVKKILPLKAYRNCLSFGCLQAALWSFPTL